MRLVLRSGGRCNLRGNHERIEKPNWPRNGENNKARPSVHAHHAQGPAAVGLGTGPPSAGHRPGKRGTHAPSRCTRTCCRAVRPTPWPPSPGRGPGGCQSLSAGLRVGDDEHFRRPPHFRSQEASGLVRGSAAPPRRAAGPTARAQAARCVSGRVDGARCRPEARCARPRCPVPSRGTSRARGGQRQPRGRRRLLFWFGRRPDGRGSRKAPQL